MHVFLYFWCLRLVPTRRPWLFLQRFFKVPGNIPLCWLVVTFSLSHSFAWHTWLLYWPFFYILFYFYGKKKRTKKVTLIIHICMLEIITLDPRKIASTGFKRQEWRWNILASWKCYTLFIPFMWKLWYHSPIKCHFYLKFQIMFSDPFKLKPILKRSIFLLFLICQQKAWKSLKIMFNKMSRY